MGETRNFGLVQIIMNDATGLWTWMTDEHENTICYIKGSLNYEEIPEHLHNDATNAYDWAREKNRMVKDRQEMEESREDLHEEWNRAYYASIAV